MLLLMWFYYEYKLKGEKKATDTTSLLFAHMYKDALGIVK